MVDEKIGGTGVRSAAVLSVAVALGLSACTGQAGAPPSTAVTAPTTPVRQELTTLHLVQPVLLGVDAATALAQARGYFTEQGFSVDYVAGSDPATSMSMVSTGTVDVGQAGFDPALFNAVQRGIDLHIVAASVAGVDFMVRKDLADSGRVRDYADLKGLTIGTLAHGNTSEYMVARALQAGGLTLADANLVVLNFPAMSAALASRAIDVGLLTEPFSTAAVQNGSAVKWKSYSDVVPGIQASGLILSPHLVQQRDLAIRWMTAYLHGVRDLDDALGKQKGRTETIQTLTGVLSVNPTLFDTVRFLPLDPDGKVNQETLQGQMQWYVQMGYLPTPLDLARVIDPSIAQAAVAKLGPYQ